jgi:hypothetical protein
VFNAVHSPPSTILVLCSPLLNLTFFTIIKMYGVEDCSAALRECPPGHLHRPTSLKNLATSLRHRLSSRGVPSDLDEAIELHRTALLLCPPGHSDRSTFLDNLATSLRDRFQQRGVSSDLDEATEFHRAALLLCPPGHSDRLISRKPCHQP